MSPPTAERKMDAPRTELRKARRRRSALKQDYYDEKVGVVRTLLIAMWCMDSSVVPTSRLPSCSVGDGGQRALDDTAYPTLDTTCT